MHSIDALFQPGSIAIFGASEKTSVGGLVLQNLIEGGFAGQLVLINPAHETILGRPCYPSLEASGASVDLALIATPAQVIPAIVEACGRQHVPAAIVFSAGFGELGAAGVALERRVLRVAREYGVRLLGPNCIGLVRPSQALNASFLLTPVEPGKLALASQSGAICSAVLDWAAAHRVGFSAVVSVGGAADIGFGELLDFLAMDPGTEAILVYVEGIRGTRRFMSGLRAAARLKPVIVLKAGRHEAGARAARSHTGALIGGHDVFEAALRRAGAVRVDMIGQLFAAANVLARYRRIPGGRLVVVTNAGGAGVMAADRAVERGVSLQALAAPTVKALGKVLPAAWSHANPIDVLGDADADRYRAAVAICLADPECDAILIMHAPTAIADPVAIASAVIDVAQSAKKPVLTCWLGEQVVAPAREAFVAAGIPTFATPEGAVESFGYLAEHHANQALLLQLAEAVAAEERAPDIAGARMIIEGALHEQRDALNERESKALLRAFDIPVNVSIPAATESAAVVAAETLGFPIAMKTESPDASHKSEVDGVRLNIETGAQAAEAFAQLRRSLSTHRPGARFDGVVVQPMAQRPNGREVMVGAFTDTVFGPTLAFGAGGTSVEVMSDRSIGLPPLNPYLADRMIDATRVSRMLGEFRGRPPVAEGAIRDVLLRLSNLVCELPEVREVDINPLIVDENGAIAVDARVFVQRSSLSRPYSHLAIHPYPAHCRVETRLPDGRALIIRPIRPSDAEAEAAFVASLSSQARYFRFMSALRELSREMVVRFTQIDYSREMALVAVVDDGLGKRQIGVGRYVGDPDYRSCEFAIVVSDEFQGQGIGRRLMRQLIDIAHDNDFERMTGEILAENEGMLALAADLGFDVSVHPEDTTLRMATLSLRLSESGA